MLWLIVRIALFIAAVVAVTYGAMILLDTPGGVSISWAGKTYAPLHPLLFAGILIVGAVALWLVFKLMGLVVALIRFVSGDETAFSRFWARRSQRKGLEALSGALIAISSGDSATATKKAARAEKLLEDPDLTRLVNAQAAQLSGDRERAETYLLAMAEDPDTEFIGLKGLIEQALEDKNPQKALGLARRAVALRNASPEILTTMFDLQSQASDWRGAKDTLKAEVRAGLITKDVGARREAVLSLADAQAAAAEGEKERARNAALAAVKKSPGLAPAAVLAAEMLADQGSTRKAASILADAWKLDPHPTLAAGFAALEPNEDTDARRKRFGRLISARPNHPESRMLQAEMALIAQDWQSARDAVRPLLEDTPSARACAIMAAVEKGASGGEEVVRGWLARAVSAPRGPQWICDNCREPAEKWTPACDNCGSFDSLNWTELSESATSAAGAAMLPLVMASEDSVEETIDEATDAVKAAEETSAAEKPEAEAEAGESKEPERV